MAIFLLNVNLSFAITIHPCLVSCQCIRFFASYLNASTFSKIWNKPLVVGYPTPSRYYSRWALTYDLLPLFLKTKDEGEPASVLSILGEGLGPRVDFNLGLKKSYSGIKAMMQSVSYNDLMVAVSYPSTPLYLSTNATHIYSSGIHPPRTQYHIHPGNVNTGMYKPPNPLYKLVVFFRPRIWLMTTSPKTCAEHILFSLLDADKGVYRRNDKGDEIGMKGFPTPEGDEEK